MKKTRAKSTKKPKAAAKAPDDMRAQYDFSAGVRGKYSHLFEKQMQKGAGITSASHKYELRIFWSQEDEAYLVEVPDLPGCMAHGGTAAEAALNAQEAIGLWIDTAREMGRDIPPPRQHRAFA